LCYFWRFLFFENVYFLVVYDTRGYPILSYSYGHFKNFKIYNPEIFNFLEIVSFKGSKSRSPHSLQRRVCGFFLCEVRSNLFWSCFKGKKSKVQIIIFGSFSVDHIFGCPVSSTMGGWNSPVIKEYQLLALSMTFFKIWFYFFSTCSYGNLLILIYIILSRLCFLQNWSFLLANYRFGDPEFSNGLF
jgi:hypothetical protein